jgi:hypothetical protein
MSLQHDTPIFPLFGMIRTDIPGVGYDSRAPVMFAVFDSDYEAVEERGSVQFCSHGPATNYMSAPQPSPRILLRPYF